MQSIIFPQETFVIGGHFLTGIRLIEFFMKSKEQRGIFMGQDPG